MTRKKLLILIGSVCLALVMVLPVLAGCAEPTPTSTPPAEPAMEPVTWLFNSGGYTGQEPCARAQEWFGEELEKRTNGLIKVEHAYLYSIAAAGEGLDACAGGLSDMLNIIWGFYPTRLYMNNFAISVPFAQPDPLWLYEIVEIMYSEETALKEELEREGMKFLWAEVKPGLTMSTMEPVNTVDDFNGKRLIIAGEMHSRMVEAVDAVPMFFSMAERSTVLETGVADGSILTTAGNYAIGVNEICPYLLRTEWGAMNIAGNVISMEVWNSLPPDIQEIVLEVAKEAQELCNKSNSAQEEELVNNILPEAGVTVSSLSFEDKVEWCERLGENILAEWVKRGEERGLPVKSLMERYMALQKESGYQLPQEWKLD